MDFTPTDANYETASKDVAINVLKGTPAITWSNPADITYGTKLGDAQLGATADVDGSFAYTPTTGTVLSAGPDQKLHVDFTPTDANYETASKDVAISVLKGTPAITWNNPADITYGTKLSGTQLNAAADVAGTFVYDPAAETVLNAGAGQTLKVTFTPTDVNYETASKDVAINVLKGTPAITWNNPADITYGTKLGDVQLNAAADVAGTFTYDPAAETLLNAGPDQKLHVEFTPTDANYETASKDVSITVLKGTPAITWSNPADITYGTKLGDVQLNAAADVAGTFMYDPAAETLLNAGAGQTLKVTFTPTDVNYEAATKDVTINVLKGTPVITWNNPADITYGTKLGDTQLGATADVAGYLHV